MTTLYELTDQYQRLAVVVEGGDPETEMPSVEYLLAECKDKLEDKVENIGKVILSLQASTETIKAEEQRLAARRKTLDNNINWLKDYLLREMSAAAIDQVKRPVVTVSLRKAPPSCQVNNLQEIPIEFRRVIPESWEPDKKAIIDHFKDSGEIVSGVEIIHDKRVVQIK